jgi:AraC-like DNA-binding protein
VQNILKESGQAHKIVEMGIIYFENPLEKSMYDRLEKKLVAVGFEIIESEADRCVSEIKHLLTNLMVSGKFKKVNISTYLSEQQSKSYNYLSRVFSAKEGETIQEYWLQLKIQKAKELLMDEHYSICDISEVIGYSSSSHFTVQFKKATKMTPKEFRTDFLNG